MLYHLVKNKNINKLVSQTACSNLALICILCSVIFAVVSPGICRIYKITFKLMDYRRPNYSRPW